MVILTEPPTTAAAVALTPWLASVDGLAEMFVRSRRVVPGLITAKRALAESVVSAGESWITEMSTDELRDVLTLRTDTVED